MKIKKLNESSLVDKKVSTLGKDGKPMYFTDDQLEDAKARYPEYDFEETTIDKSLPQGQKAYIAKLKEAKQIKVFGAKGKKLNEAKIDIHPGEWVEVNLATRKGERNIIPVKVDKELYHGYSFLGWAWGERQHEYNMSSIVGKIDGDDTTAIIRKYSMNEAADINAIVSKYNDAFYDEEQQLIDCGSEETCRAIAKELGVGPDRTSNSPVAHEIWLDESKRMNESIEVATIADYITDHYEFDDIEDKYSCINSIRDSFKDEKTISKEELEQFIGAHNGRDKVEEALTEDKGQSRSNRYATYFNRIKKAIENGDEETLQRTKEAIMYAPAKELKNSEASELMDMIKNRKINEASYGGAFDIEDDQYFTRDDLNSFAEEVLGHISETFEGKYDIGGVWFENGNVTTQIVDSEGNEFQDTTHVDMRRIREPWHLKKMYAFPAATSLIAQIKSFLKDSGVITENVRGMGDYSDKFYDYLDYLSDNGNTGAIEYLASQLIRFCKESDLKDLWGYKIGKVAQDNGFDDDAVIEEGIMDEFHKAQRYLDFEIPDTCKDTADKLPNMTEQDMVVINKHCMKFKDVLDYYSTKASSSNEALEERFDGETHKVVAVAFDVIAPVEMTESEIEVELTDAVNKSKVEVSGGYMEVHTLDEALKEALQEDVAVPVLEGPKEGPESGLSSLLNEAMQDELKTIQMYNDIAVTARSEGFEDIASQVDEINTEENKHVGQLQELLKTISPNAQAIDAGEAEAGDALVVVEEGNNPAETPNNNIEESADMKKERWEEIYDSFKTVEAELNQDGEAVTAVIDQMYRDNKEDPDYQKAYDKWAAGE